MKKIGILGGSFDPFHLGHLSMAKASLTKLGLDKILVTPAYLPPHKKHSIKASFEQRCEMINLSILKEERIHLSYMDRESGDYNYTLNLLKRFRMKHPNDKLYFIIGEDSFYDFPSWYKPIEILQLATLIIIPRNTENVNMLEEKALEYKFIYQGEILIVPMSLVSISSSMIREAIQNKHSIARWVDPNVERYIYEQKLYRQ